jgi:hypothetical protein
MSDRKHTPLTSEAERGLYGAALGAKRAGKPKPSYVPQSLWEESEALLAYHLKESKGKKLPKYAGALKRRAKLRRRKRYGKQ